MIDEKKIDLDSMQAHWACLTPLETFTNWFYGEP